MEKEEWYIESIKQLVKHFYSYIILPILILLLIMLPFLPAGLAYITDNNLWYWLYPIAIVYFKILSIRG